MLQSFFLLLRSTLLLTRGIAFAARNLTDNGTGRGISNLAPSDTERIETSLFMSDNSYGHLNIEQGIEMSFDIDYGTADITGLIPTDGCFVIGEEGYAKYVC